MAESIFIQFDPERIAEVATGVQARHSEIVQNMESIRQQSNKLKTSWNSDQRADDYYSRFSELDKKGEELAGILYSYSVNLNQTAGIYTTGEQDVKQVVQELPTDGIFQV